MLEDEQTLGLDTGLEYLQPPVDDGLPDTPHGDGLEHGLPDMLHPDLLGNRGRYFLELNPLFPLELYRGAAPGVNPGEPSLVNGTYGYRPGLNPEFPVFGVRGT